MALPKTLQRLLDKNPHIIEEIFSEDDGWHESGKPSWWVYFRPGWIDPSTEVHQIHEHTAKEVIEAFRRVVPCDCEECLRMIGQEKQRRTGGTRSI